MTIQALQVRVRGPATTLLFAVSFVGLATLSVPGSGAPFATVPKANCGPNDQPETALQGQVPAALRASGFHGFNCNLELLSQVRGDGANWQSAEYRDSVGNAGSQGKANGRARGAVCAYHGTAFSTAGRTQVGVP